MIGHVQLRSILAGAILSVMILLSMGCGVTFPTGTLAIAAISSPLLPGSTTQLHLIVTMASGESRDVTNAAAWTTSNESVAMVSTGGVLRAISAGEATIAASTPNAAANLHIVVGVMRITSLSITAPAVSLPTNSTEQYTATATYSDKSTRNVSTSVQWAVSNTTIATISNTGLLIALLPGNITVKATSSGISAMADATISAASQPGTSTMLPIPVYTGANLSQFPVLNVSDYAASGSSVTGTCTGLADSTALTCTGLDDLARGQGIRIVGGGKAPAEAAITTQPLVSPGGNQAGGTHTYCYVVDTVDPLGGISTPSPQTCVNNEPALGLTTASNYLTTATSNVGPSPTFLWYVSEDGGPFLLFNIAKFVSGAPDLGQRIGSRGGWPDSLPPANPSIAKQDDLFSTVEAINGNQVTIADALASSVQGATADHDDTQAIENAILASLSPGGATIVFGSGTFNVRRPAFAYVQNNSFAYPPYTTNLAWDPWWGGFSYLYIPNGSAGNIKLLGAGRKTTLVTPPDHGGVAQLLSVGNEARVGAAPIMAIEQVAVGATQVTLVNQAAAAILSPGDDIFLYSGSYGQAPVTDEGATPDVNHFTELNTVASVSGNTIQLVYPTSKRFFDDGGSSFGMTRMPLMPHNIEIEHLNISTSEPIVSSGDVIGLLVNDVQVQGVLSQGAFGGGYKRGVTIMNSQWTFGQGTAGWGQEDEYDDFTDLAFLNNTITGYAAPASEGSSRMARIYATEGTSEVLFEGNTFDHVSLYADQTSDFYVQKNTFYDGIIAAGVAYGADAPGYAPLALSDRSFLSFGSQEALSINHNTLTITPDFNPPWVIRAGDFASGNISNNLIMYSGTRAPGFIIASFNGTVLNNTISIQTPTANNIIALVPDESPSTPMSTFTAEGNVTRAHVIDANIIIPATGFTDAGAVCIQNNIMQVSQGAALDAASSIVNLQCP